MEVDVFAEARRLVSAREVAELNGFHPNRSGFICCPLHGEKTASLKLYENGSWYCFGCNRGGSSIDLVAALNGLTPLDAVRRLNEDFHLALPLDKPPDKEMLKAARRRREFNDTYQLFERWRREMLQKLVACFREGHFALQSLETPADLDQLTEGQALAIQWQATVDYWADCLLSGSMAVQMAVFRDRKGVEALCQRILNHTPRKFGAA